MKTVLETAHTWFLEASTQSPNGALRIRLVEGIKGKERLPVKVGDQVLGSYFPVTIEPSSRVVEVCFPNTLALFTYNESYDSKDSELVAEEGRLVLRKVSASSFRTYTASSTTAFELGREPITEWLLWTENQIFQVISSGEPTVAELSAGPDLSIERYQTWTAS